MDESPGSDRMDWEADSSLHIIQPASSPWRKRSFDIYNETNDPYNVNDAYPGYQVTDTLRNDPEAAAPFIDYNNQPAQYVTDFDGNVTLQPTGHQPSRPPIGHYLPEWVKWLIYGVTLLVCSSVELAGDACIHTAAVAVRAGNSAKRRLVEVTKTAFPPDTPTRRRRHDVSPRRRQSPILRRVSPTLPGGRTHIPVTPPRARPMATLRETATVDYDCVVESIPNNAGPSKSGLFVASSQIDHLSSGIAHQPQFEPLMSGALQDTMMDENSPSTDYPSTPFPHLPGTFPKSPAPPTLPALESPATDLQASDNLNTPHHLGLEKSTQLDEKAVDEAAPLHNEAFREPDIPEVRAAVKPLPRKVDSRPRNYKGELLDNWQIRVCKQFQAIHPPPREIGRPANSVPGKRQKLKPAELIKHHLSPLASDRARTLDKQHETTATNFLDSRRSSLANTSRTGTVGRVVDLYGSNSEPSYLPHGLTSIGLNKSHRSSLDPHRATADNLQEPRARTSSGLNDLHKSPLVDVSPAIGYGKIKESHDETLGEPHQPVRMAAVGSMSPVQSPSPISCGTNFLEIIDSPQSPLDDAMHVYAQPEMSPTESNDSPGSALAASLMEAAVNATNIDTGGPDVSENIQDATHAYSRSPPTGHLATVNTAPAKSPSSWSIRSLYARVQGKPKKRSPLSERINNSNVHKAPKTPKKVSWPEDGPVTATKRFIKHEAMFHPSPTSSGEDSSILSSVPSSLSPHFSPSMQEDVNETVLNRSSISKLFSYRERPDTAPSDGNDISKPASNIEQNNTMLQSDENHDTDSSSLSEKEGSVRSVETPTKTATSNPSTPPFNLSPKFEELSISTRRSSLRRREKEDQAKKLREAIAAEEKARKDKEEAEARARKEKEEAEEKARAKAAEEEERKKSGGRRIPIESVIQSLPSGWDEKIRVNMAKGMREQLAMTSIGNPLTRRDFGMVLPQPGTGDDASGWLNDEIISGYLQAVVDHGHRTMGHPRGAKPRMHAFTPFFYTTLKDRGYDAVKRWSNRAKIGGNDLKSVEYVFIPCNPNKVHWTLIVVSPVRKTIEVFDSMHGDSVDKVRTTKSWLRGEMGRSYVESEWTVVEDPKLPGRGKGPVQNNANDCGVFTVTTAKMVVLGVDPMAVSARDMPLQRRRLVAELLNGGFSGDFEPRVVFE